MRGFRASRAALNFKTAHSKWETKHNFKVIDGGQFGNAQPEDQKKPLPDWLKMPAQSEQKKKPEAKQHLRVVPAMPVVQQETPVKKTPVKRALKAKSVGAAKKKAPVGAKTIVRRKKVS